MGATVDFEAVRHRLKLLRDTGDTRLFENRGDVPCPVCGGARGRLHRPRNDEAGETGLAFDEALATSERSRRLRSEQSLDVCIVREADELVVFTHA